MTCQQEGELSSEWIRVQKITRIQPLLLVSYLPAKIKKQHTPAWVFLCFGAGTDAIFEVVTLPILILKLELIPNQLG